MTSPLFYFLFSVLIYFFGTAVTRFVPFYRDSTLAAKSHRYQSIDGLRGLLAFGVFVHHSVCYYFLFATGAWGAGTAFYSGLGSHFVSLFFMITGFLFWSKVIHERGRLPIKDFFKSRMLRIFPMYYCATILVLVLIGYKTHWQILTSSADLTREIFHVLLGGFAGYGEINKSGNDILNGVFWTLRLEWRYYVFLPLTAIIFYGSALRKIILILLVLLLCQVLTKEVQYFQFVIGGLAAELVARGKLNRFLRSRVASLFALACLAFVFFFLGSNYSWPQTLVLGLFFTIIASGNTLFQILILPGSIFLGTISYSAYLIHTSILFICFTLFTKLASLNGLSIFEAWLFILFCGTCVLAVSSLTYRFIEAPFIEIGKSRPLPKSGLP